MAAQIIDLQRRIAEVGRIRIGEQATSSNGRKRPAKLDTFRLTSADKLRIEQAAALYGGDVKKWSAPAGPQWEVITTAAVLDVIVPPSDMAFSQAYEQWSAGGCQRRCNGQFEQISDGPCICDPDQRDCNIHTRLSVMLRDLPGLGVWRIDTSGYYAAVELQGAVHVIQLAAGQGRMLPARLRLDQRQVKRMVDGKPQTRKFPVPVLDVDVTFGELMASTVNTETGEITDGGTPAVAPGLTAVPAALPAGPVESIAAQAATVEDESVKQRGTRKSAPLPETGVAPRTAAAAADDDEVVEGEIVDTDPPDPVADDMVTDAQLKAMHTAFSLLGADDRESRLAFAKDVVGREIGSSKDLSKREASRVIDAIQADLDGEAS